MARYEKILRPLGTLLNPPEDFIPRPVGLLPGYTSSKDGTPCS